MGFVPDHTVREGLVAALQAVALVVDHDNDREFPVLRSKVVGPSLPLACKFMVAAGKGGATFTVTASATMVLEFGMPFQH